MLTDAKLRHIKPQPRMKRCYDTRGLYLQAMPHDGRYWRLKYHVQVGSRPQRENARPRRLSRYLRQI